MKPDTAPHQRGLMKTRKIISVAQSTFRMKGLRHGLLLFLWLIYAVMWVGGISTHLFARAASVQVAWAAPVFLLLAGLITLTGGRGRAIMVLALAALVGLAGEMVGVRTELIFGSYYYTDALRPCLLGVPLVMASAWMVLIAYVSEMVAGSGLSLAGELLLAAAWMTAIDLVIDPLAAGPLGYWRWAAPGLYYGIPARNFLGWFVLSLLIFAGVRKFSDCGRQANLTARPLGLSIISFFTLIALLHRLTWAVAAGTLLCLGHLALSSSRRVQALKAGHR